MPHALGLGTPLWIASGGILHTIRTWVDPAGEVRTSHEQQPAPTTSRTRIDLILPVRAEDQEFDPQAWAADFALFNPHALVQISVSDDHDERGEHAC